MQAIDMADCRTSYDIQKHEVIICSELDPPNVFGMDLTLCYFFPFEKKKGGSRQGSWPSG